MTDKKFKVGDMVKVTRSFKTNEGPTRLVWDPRMSKFVGQICPVTDISDTGNLQLRYGNDRWYFYPRVLEHVNKSHAACILTEKVTVGDVPCRKILGFEGILRKEDLPAGYVNGKPAFYIDDSWAQNVRIFEGHGYEIGDYMGDPVCWLYVPNECEHEVRFEGYNPALSAGCVLKESDFQAWIKWMRRAGSRLAKIRKQEKDAWSGKETVEI